jgi:mycothiol S-conjugate amidase
VTYRLLLIHAHPDDEASKRAATAAHYVDEGHEVVLVTCTGGEAGEVLNPNAEAVDPAVMADVRARELEAAVAAIGFTRTYGLGYVDSGYHEDPADVPEGTFARAPLDEPSRTIAGIIRRERPHVIVTYPEDGGYPHPDHIMNHLVTVRGMELAEDPAADLGDVPGSDLPAWRVPKVYASDIFPPERVTALHHAMLEQDLDDFAGKAERTGKVGVHDVRQAHVVELVEIAVVGDAGIVHQDVQPFETLDGLSNETGRRGRVLHVCLHPREGARVRVDQGLDI